MTDLVTVLAGGMVEARRYVKHELSKSRYYTIVLAIGAAISLFAAGSIAYYKF